MINKMNLYISNYYKLLLAINDIVSSRSMATINNNSNQLYSNNQQQEPNRHIPLHKLIINEATYQQYNSRYSLITVK